jgi:hypothetical protein
MSDLTTDEQAVVDAQLTGRLPGLLTSRFALETYRQMLAVIADAGYEVTKR